MLNFFDMIADFFANIWQMLINIVTSLTNAIIIVSSATSLPVQLLAFVPSFIGASVSIVFAIGVTKLIIGWGNS